jgi:hypothetical protein
MQHYWEGREDQFDDANVKRQEIFRRCLIVGNTKLVTQFQKQAYLQLQGLAMGVADSPDLANLYGWEFERAADILNDAKVPLYGRYIDDCLAIVYASSEEEAVNYMSNRIKYDNCTIEWSASEQFQPFLDMCLYIDENHSLQHMPYRKARNHLERIPWISNHPLDVKRGTLIGEMSRMAVLSSSKQTYVVAVKELMALYVKRGYPRDLVEHWVKNNMSKRWENRLNTVKQEKPDVLILKTEFNPVWNYFNASELGETILGYWREWLSRADSWNFNNEFPAPLDNDAHDLLDVMPTALRPFAPSEDIAPVFVPDVRKTSILNRRMITSRKRTKNLFDLTSLWKKIVLEELDARVASPIDGPHAQNAIRDFPLVVDEPAMSVPLGEREVSPEDEDRNIHQRRASPVPTQWRLGRM